MKHILIQRDVYELLERIGIKLDACAPEPLSAGWIRLEVADAVAASIDEHRLEGESDNDALRRLYSTRH